MGFEPEASGPVNEIDALASDGYSFYALPSGGWCAMKRPPVQIVDGKAVIREGVLELSVASLKKDRDKPVKDDKPVKEEKS